MASSGRLRCRCSGLRCAGEGPLNTGGGGEVQPQGQKEREEARKIQSLVQCRQRRLSENEEVAVISHEGPVKNRGRRATGVAGKKSLTLKKPNGGRLLKSLALQKEKKPKGFRTLLKKSYMAVGKSTNVFRLRINN